MPPRPLPEGSARSARSGAQWMTRLRLDSARRFRALAASRGIPDQALLTALVLAQIEARTGYRDTARRPAPRRRAGNEERRDPLFAPRLSAEESRLADQLRAEDGMTRSAWLRWLAERELAAAADAPPPEPPAPGTPQPSASLPPLDPGAFLQDRGKAVREAKEAGYTLRGIGEACGVSHETVRQILKRGERFDWVIFTEPVSPTGCPACGSDDYHTETGTDGLPDYGHGVKKCQECGEEWV